MTHSSLKALELLGRHFGWLDHRENAGTSNKPGTLDEEQFRTIFSTPELEAAARLLAEAISSRSSEKHSP